MMVERKVLNFFAIRLMYSFPRFRQKGVTAQGGASPLQKIPPSPNSIITIISECLFGEGDKGDEAYNEI
jgi:hypothetical protein